MSFTHWLTHVSSRATDDAGTGRLDMERGSRIVGVAWLPSVVCLEGVCACVVNWKRAVVIAENRWTSAVGPLKHTSSTIVLFGQSENVMQSELAVGPWQYLDTRTMIKRRKVEDFRRICYL